MSKGISLTGDKQLDKLFRQLPKTLSKKVIRGALRESAKPMVKTTRQNIKSNGLVKSGNLARSIGIISDRSRQFKGSIRMGARMRKNGSRNMKGWHAHFLEFGTAPRKPKNSKKLVFQGKNGIVSANSVRGVQARPFMRPAFDSTHKVVTDEFGQIAGTRLYKEMNRVIKKHGS